mmetsp:Transcript_36215/g.89945  ORF Transcript_36215/g.89945 Transcript_36215/m.89945 type:complete len:268 (+) Transcript_36215:208-1011(+)
MALSVSYVHRAARPEPGTGSSPTNASAPKPSAPARRRTPRSRPPSSGCCCAASARSRTRATWLGLAEQRHTSSPAPTTAASPTARGRARGTASGQSLPSPLRGCRLLTARARVAEAAAAVASRARGEAKGSKETASTAPPPFKSARSPTAANSRLPPPLERGTGRSRRLGGSECTCAHASTSHPLGSSTNSATAQMLELPSWMPLLLPLRPSRASSGRPKPTKLTPSAPTFGGGRCKSNGWRLPIPLLLSLRFPVLLAGLSARLSLV